MQCQSDKHQKIRSTQQLEYIRPNAMPDQQCYLHNNVFAHGTVTNDDDQPCHDQRAWPIGPTPLGTLEATLSQVN